MVVPSLVVVLVAPFLVVVPLVDPFPEALLGDHASLGVGDHLGVHEALGVRVVLGDHVVQVAPFHVVVHSLDQMAVFQKVGPVVEDLSCQEDLSFLGDLAYQVDPGILVVALGYEMVEALVPSLVDHILLDLDLWVREILEARHNRYNLVHHDSRP